MKKTNGMVWWRPQEPIEFSSRLLLAVCLTVSLAAHPQQPASVVSQSARQAVAAAESTGGAVLATALESLAEELLAQPAPALAEAEDAARRALQLREQLGDVASTATAHQLLAEVFQRQENLEDARSHLEQSVKMRIDHFGSEHSSVADGLQALAGVLMAGGHYTYARDFYGQALAIRAAVYGPMHPLVAETLFNQATLFEQIGEDSEALRLHQQALAIRETSLGSDHPKVAESLIASGRMLQFTGELNSAIAPLQRALEIEATTTPQRPLQLAEVQSTLAGVLLELHQRQGVESLLESAISLRRGVPDASIPLAVSLTLRGRYHRDEQQYQQALPYFREATEIFERETGMSADTITSLNNLASTLWDVKQYSEALPLLERISNSWEQLDGEQSPYLPPSLVNEAELNWEMGRFVEARRLFERATGLYRDMLGDAHPTVASQLSRLGKLALEMGDYGAAGPLFSELLAIREQSLGPDHQSVADAYQDLGQLMLVQGDLDAANDKFQQSLRIRRALGENHPLYADTLSALATVEIQRAEFGKALPLLQQALAIRQQAYGPDNPRVAQSYAEIASMYFLQGEFEQAQPLQEQALQITEAFYGADHPQVAPRLSELANTMVARARPTEALPLFQKSLKMWEELLGPDHPRVATTLNDLANLYRSTGQYVRAKELYLRSRDIWQKALGDESLQMAATLNNLGNLAADTGDFELAGESYRQALQVRRKLIGDQHPEVATSLNNLAEFLRIAGDYEEARPLYMEALQLRRRLFGERHPLVAASLNNYGRFLAEVESSDEARVMLGEALSIWEQALGPQHPNVAVALSNLASLAADRSQYQEALDLYKRVLQIRQEKLGESHREVGITLNNMAEVYRDQGDYSTARPLYQQAIRTWTGALGPDHPDVATGLTNLGVLLVDMGDDVEARRNFETALRIRQKALGPRHPDVAASLYRMALLERDAGEMQQAITLMTESLAIREESAARPTEIAISLSGLAGLQRRIGNFDQAKTLYDRALSLWEKAGGNDLNIAAIVNSLGILEHEKGNRPAAEKHYRRALEIWGAHYGENHPDLAIGLNNLATLMAETGRIDEALEMALRAESIGRQQLQLTVRTLPERQALRYATVRVSGLDLILSLAVQKNAQLSKVAGSALNALVLSRALVLDEMAARRQEVLRSTDPQVSELARQLAESRERLARLTLRGPGKGSAQQYQEELAAADRQKEELEEQLAQKNAGSSRERRRRMFDLNQVIAKIPAESRVVSFAQYRHHDLSGQGSSGLRYAAFVTASGGKLSVVPLGDAAEIDSLVSRWHNEAARGIITQIWDQPAAEKNYRVAGDMLRQKIWEPLLPHLGTARMIFLVPDGSLNLVSFQSLPTGSGQYLVETGPTLHYLSAERDLARLDESSTAGSGMLVIGGADFGLQEARRRRLASSAEDPAAPALIGDACNEFDLIEFDPLPGARQEAQEVASLWSRYRDSEASTLVGTDALEEKFKSQAPGKRVLHLATHGFILGQSCGVNAADLFSSGLLSDDEATGGPASENPLLRSGLALAGANDIQSGTTDDGILTAEEVAALDLSKTQWAVLSACNTGVGEVQAGEGVLGLRRAFQVAGAGALIMSLWPVDDLSTRQLMQLLYEARLQEGLNTADSLQKAAREMISARRNSGLVTHPFFWGAFVAAGDWR